MKNARLTKFFLIILSLALLVGSLVGIAASASDSDTYEIKSINISHGDNVQVLIAVDADVSEKDNIEVKYTYNGEEYTAKYWKNIAIYADYGDTTEYPVWYTVGIAAKDIGESIMAEAHKVGTTPAEPAYKNVSVSEYLFTKLYIEGYVAKTEGEDLDRKNLYLKHLEYGAAAQKALWNNKQTDSSLLRTLVTDLKFVYANNATVNGAAYAILTENGNVTLEYEGSGALTGWNVTTWNAGVGTTVFTNSNTVAITGCTTIEPYFDPYTVNFEGDSVGEGVMAVGTTSDDSGWTGSEVQYVGEISGITATLGGGSNTNISQGNINIPGSKLVIEENSINGNKYLHFVGGAKSSVSGGSKGRHIFPEFQIKDESSNPNVSVIEMDLTINSVGSYYRIANFGFISENGHTVYPFIEIKSTAAYLYDRADTTNAITALPLDTLFNLRFEYYFGEEVCQVYVNGIYKGNVTTLQSTGRAHEKPVKFQWGTESSATIDVELDNVILKNTEKTYVASPEVNPVIEDFEGSYTPELVEWTCSSVSETQSAVNLLFKTGISISFSSGNSYSNTQGATAAILTDSLSGNKYVNIYTPKRIASSDRAYGVKILPQVLDSTHSVYVLEADIKLDSTLADGAGSHKSPLNMIIYSNEGKYVQFNMTNNSYADITLGGHQIGYWNEWNSVRMELYTDPDTASDTDTPVIKVYTKNTAGEYEYKFTYTVTDSAGLANLVSGVRDWSINCANSTDYGASLNIDNACLYTSDKAYVAE